MGCYNEYPLGVNGMDDWFLSYGPNSNVAQAAHFSQHMGELNPNTGASMYHDSRELEFFGVPAWVYLLSGAAIYILTKKK